MTKPTVKIHDLTTGEVIEREMNNAEFAQFEAEQAIRATEKAKAEAKATAKSALLNKLGITAEEAAE